MSSPCGEAWALEAGPAEAQGLLGLEAAAELPPSRNPSWGRRFRRLGLAAGGLALVAALLAAATGGQVRPDAWEPFTAAETSFLVSLAELANKPSCANASGALHKVHDLIKAHSHADAAEQKVDKDIASHKTGPGMLHQIESVLNHHSLKDALATGEVLTSADMDNIAECELGGKMEHMEEHETAENGDPMVEGDMAVHGGDAHGRRLLDCMLTDGTWAGDLWPQGEVKYCFQPNARQAVKDSMKAAIKHIEDQVPCIKFKDVGEKSTDACAQTPSFVVLTPTKRVCSAYVGLSAWFKDNHKSQSVTLGQGCESLGIVAHEMAHVLGMTHEHSRSDRRHYIEIVKDKIKESSIHNFKTRDDAYKGMPYDLLSLMHYSATTFSKDGSMTLEAHDHELSQYMGQREGLSELDVEQLGEMYGCKDTVTPLLRNKELSTTLSERAKTSHAPRTQNGCLCHVSTNSKCGTVQNGFCCNPDSNPNGTWCFTDGACNGKDRDYCIPKPPPPNLAQRIFGSVGGACNKVKDSVGYAWNSVFR
mmetsp:Transcript_64305/g.207164  ORF Transcript_64305/g.207164 Transcript_64305/m.207164 type:complete len:534 (+) Transcript_64305:89-1690(+)